jgi:hypothetical protein
LPFRTFHHRRPSAPLVISLLALFVSLGGVGYAAISIPPDSVGAAQLRNESVTYTKIAPGAVGDVRANTNQLQERVNGSCGLYSGIGAISKTGSVECLPSLPPEAGTVNTVPVPVPSTVTNIDNIDLQRAGNSQTRSATIDTGTSTAASSTSIPLQLAGESGATFVDCMSSSSATPAATVSVTSALNAIETGS